jgi:hypothetical protein
MARIGPEEVRQRYGVEPQQVPDFIALPATHRTSCRAHRASDRRAQRHSCAGTVRSRIYSRTVDSRISRMNYASIAG